MNRRSLRPPHGRRPGRGRFVLASASSLVGLIVAGCGKPPAQAGPAPPTVGVVRSASMTVPVEADPNGTTRALQEVTLRARVRGFLTEVKFDEGATVKAGDLLFVIDEEPYRVALQSAQARKSEAEAALSKAEQSKAREVAKARLALDRASLGLSAIEEQRSRNLLARSAGSREDFDKSEATRKQYEAQVEADQASLEQASADYEVGILTAKAQLAAAEAAVRDAQINLGYCRMTAPIDGRIGEAKVKVGNLVGPDSGGGAFTELATIQQLDPMGVDIRASSRYLDRATRLIHQGLSIRLTRPGLEGDIRHPYEGQLFFIDNAVDPTTSTFLTKAKIPNPDRTLLPGEYVKLDLVVDKIEDAVVVPETAVLETESGPTVYVVDKGGKVAVQKVEAGTTYRGLRVIESGLTPGVPVIVHGIQLVRPGIPVKVEEASMPRPVEEPSVAEPAPTPSPGPGSAGGKPGSAGREPSRPANEAESRAVEPGGPRSALPPGSPPPRPDR